MHVEMLVKIPHIGKKSKGTHFLNKYIILFCLPIDFDMKSNDFVLFFNYHYYMHVASIKLFLLYFIFLLASLCIIFLICLSFHWHFLLPITFYIPKISFANLYFHTYLFSSKFLSLHMSFLPKLSPSSTCFLPFVIVIFICFSHIYQ